jgi:hypothetical protein
MILRVIRGRADRDQLAALQAALEDRLGAGPDAAFGPDRHHVGVRPGDGADEVLLLACWRSAEAAAAGDARDVSPFRLASRHLEDVRVEHFEIDRNVLRDPDARPIALRVATGRFSRPGGDIRMQDLLRERLSSVGPEMSEAYVGRRLLGRTLDVTFVSVWQARPPGQRLEDPFWPDISIQYDEFSVEVYGPVD